MKTARNFLLLAILFLLVVFLFQKPQAPVPSLLSPAPTPSSLCDPALGNHVYHPSRLKIISPCLEVTGTIDSIKPEDDGDYHIRLKLDLPYSHLLNSENLKSQKGNLVVEPICQIETTYPPAKTACHGFKSSLAIPPEGTHIKIAGSYVADLEHGWMEIHPLSTIQDLSP